MNIKEKQISLYSLTHASSENLISAVHYMPAKSGDHDYDDDDDFDGADIDDLPIKERLVRLMSVDVKQMRRKSVSTTESEEILMKACPQYWDIIPFAESFVDDIIEEAEGLINKHAKVSMIVRTLPSMERLPSKIHSEFSDFPRIAYERPKFSTWPTIREFTIELGADKIDEYLASFNTDEEWLYIIYFIGVNSDDTSNFYEYEATWSLPSPEYPIAQATASVFFTIEVSKVLPEDCLVNVTFVFENHQFKHIPGLTDFNEDWLNYILDSKIGVFKKIKF